MRITLSIGLLLLMLSACKAPRQVMTSEVVVDTVVVEQTISFRDTVFFADTAVTTVMIPIEKLDDKIDFTQINKQAQLTVKVVRDTVYIQCKCDTVAIEAQLRDSIVKQIRMRKEIKRETKIVKERFIPNFVKTLAWTGGICIVLIAAGITLKIKNII